MSNKKLQFLENMSMYDKMYCKKQLFTKNTLKYSKLLTGKNIWLLFYKHKTTTFNHVSYQHASNTSKNKINTSTQQSELCITS